MSDFEAVQKELQKLEKEVIETRNMNIKTDNNMRSLFAELKKVSKNQTVAERKARIGHIGLYVLFVTAIAVLAIVLSNSRADTLEQKIVELNQRLEKTQKQAETYQREIDSRDTAEKRAFLILKLIRDEKKVKTVEEFRKIDHSRLSNVLVSLLQEKVDAFSRDLARKHFEQGASQWRIGGYKSAVQEFEKSQWYLKDTEYTGELKNYYGLSLIQIKKTDDGIRNLKEAIGLDLPRHVADAARLKIADTLIGGKRYDEALHYLKGVPQDQLGFYTRQAVNQKIRFVEQKLAAEKKATPEGQ